MAYKYNNSGNKKSDCGIIPHLAFSGRVGKRIPSLISSKDNKNNVKTDNLRSSRAHRAAAGAIKQLTRPNVQVFPINVGQGDSILLKLQYEQGTLYPRNRFN